MRTRNPNPGRSGAVTLGYTHARASSGRHRSEDTAGNEASGHTTIYDGATVTDLPDGYMQVTISGAASGGGTGETGTPTTVVASGSALTIELGTFTVIDITLTANCTFTFTAPEFESGEWTFILRQDAVGSRTVTWPATVDWQETDGTGGGSAPTLFTAAEAMDVIKITTLDSGATYGGASVRGDHRLMLNLTSGDPHTQYVLESSSSWVDLTDGGGTSLHSHGGATSPHILLADGHPTPFAFTDLLQMDDGTDFMWSDP